MTLNFDDDNLFETAKYCKTHNGVLIDYSIDDIILKLKNHALRYFESDEYEELNLQSAWGAFFDISVQRAGSVWIDLVPLKEDRYSATFFVRLGRRPYIRQVTDDHLR